MKKQSKQVKQVKKIVRKNQLMNIKLTSKQILRLWELMSQIPGYAANFYKEKYVENKNSLIEIIEDKFSSQFQNQFETDSRMSLLDYQQGHVSREYMDLIGCFTLSWVLDFSYYFCSHVIEASDILNYISSDEYESTYSSRETTEGPIKNEFGIVRTTEFEDGCRTLEISVTYLGSLTFKELEKLLLNKIDDLKVWQVQEDVNILEIKKEWTIALINSETKMLEVAKKKEVETINELQKQETLTYRDKNDQY